MVFTLYYRDAKELLEDLAIRELDRQRINGFEAYLQVHYLKKELRLHYGRTSSPYGVPDRVEIFPMEHLDHAVDKFNQLLREAESNDR